MGRMAILAGVSSSAIETRSENHQLKHDTSFGVHSKQVTASVTSDKMANGQKSRTIGRAGAKFGRRMCRGGIHATHSVRIQLKENLLDGKKYSGVKLRLRERIPPHLSVGGLIARRDDFKEIGSAVLRGDPLWSVPEGVLAVHSFPSFRIPHFPAHKNGPNTCDGDNLGKHRSADEEREGGKHACDA
jgi:hypothetical protein